MIVKHMLRYAAMLLLLTISTTANAIKDNYTDPNKPILVFSPGKVGSTSVWLSLEKYRKHVFHFHQINEEVLLDHLPRYAPDMPIRLNNNIKLQKEYSLYEPRPFELSDKDFNSKYADIVSLKRRKGHWGQYVQSIHIREEGYLYRPIDIICMVRDPIARNISHFFQKSKAFYKLDPNKPLPNNVYETFRNEYDHDQILTWFDKEFKDALGIDIAQINFPKEKGHMVIEKGNLRILLFKIELSDQKIEAIIKDFLNLDEFKLDNSNIGAKKDYARNYKEFKKNLSLNKNYVAKMLNSEYTTTFYTPEEVENMLNKYIKS